MSHFKTEQESFWAWDFWEDYISRNDGDKFLANQIAFWSQVLRKTWKIASIIELGSNVGINLKAMGLLLPEAELSAVEINSEACKVIEDWSHGKVKVFNESILNFSTEKTREFSFTKWVLIHINPENLNEAYDCLYATSSRYICVAEYYNPTPAEMSYRWNTGKLFKRDFCAEIMKRFADLDLVDYGFTYRFDPSFPQDDVTWFLLEKKGE